MSRSWFIAAGLAAALIAGCEDKSKSGSHANANSSSANAEKKDEDSAGAPASAPTSAPRRVAEAKPDVIPRESLKWTREQAATHLRDEQLAVAAAVRVARIDKIKNAAIPEPLTKDQAGKLRVVRVKDDLFALGLPDAKASRIYHSVLLLDGAGQVVKPGPAPLHLGADHADEDDDLLAKDADAKNHDAGEGDEDADRHARSPFGDKKGGKSAADKPGGTGSKSSDDEAAGAAYGDWTLYQAADPDVFPRLIMGDKRVFRSTDLEEPLMKLVAPQSAWFDVRFKNEFPFVALIVGDAPGKEVAQFRWDPYEESFFGPAKDKLPAEMGGSFELDLAESNGLQPVGGEIEEPAENVPLPTPQRPGEDDGGNAPPY